MKIALGADSAGKPLLDVIEAHLRAKGEHAVTNMSRDGFYADLSAAVAHDTYSAERAAKSNNAQIITMGAGVIGPELNKAIVDTWLAPVFDPNEASAANAEAINRLDQR